MSATKVIFRKFQDGSIIAMFPEIPAECNSWYNMQSYMHIGQHSSASPNLVYDTKLAIESEYTDLLKELESIGYTLKVCKRITLNMDTMRQQTWRNMV